MKKVLFFAAAIAALALGTTSCNKTNDPSNEPFAIEVTNITYNAADVAIVAADSNALFTFALMETELYTASSPDTIVAELFEYCDMLIAIYEQYAGTKVPYAALLSKGYAASSFKDLQENTEYTVFACSLDTINKKLAGKMVSKNFTTTEFEPTSNLTFVFTKNAGIINIAPSDNNETYAFMLLTEDELKDGGLMDKLNYYAKAGWDEEYVANGAQDIDLHDYAYYAGDYTLQAAAVKVTEVKDGKQTYNEYERLSKISSFSFNYTTKDGGEEEAEDAPARAKKLMAKPQANKIIFSEPILK